MAAGRKTGGRQKGSRNKATVAREKAEARSLAEAAAALFAGVDPAALENVSNIGALENISGLHVMRLAMLAHLQAGALDKAAVWGEKVAPYEVSKLAPRDPNAEKAETGIVVTGGLPENAAGIGPASTLPNPLSE